MRGFCNFLQDFRPPLGKSRPPLRVGGNFSGEGEKNFRTPKLFIFNFLPPVHAPGPNFCLSSPLQTPGERYTFVNGIRNLINVIYESHHHKSIIKTYLLICPPPRLGIN